jgi:RNA polymerase sigma factor (sigma-70 family)
MATTELGTLVRHLHGLAGGGTREQSDRHLLSAFAERHDQEAFAALVARHGVMVFRTCRSVLHHEQDAEDALQATFLVLARRARSIRKHDAVAQWLHGVALRTAKMVRRSAARRHHREAQLRERRPTRAPGPSWDDVRAVLDEEIQALPVHLRSAFVLCVLEGKTVREASANLGAKEGTTSSRLTRARQLLQRRLVRRGIELTAVLAALSIATSVCRAALPATLVQTILRFGALVAAGEPAAGVIPGRIAALAAGVTRAMFLAKAKITTLVLIALGLIAIHAGMLVHQATAKAGPPPQAQAPERRGPKPSPAGARGPAAEDKGNISYNGRVLGPDGRPVSGAKLYVTPTVGHVDEPFATPERGTTGADGGFRFTVAKESDIIHGAIVVATVANLGPAWVTVPADAKREDLTLQLVTDDVPVTGQIVDLEGRAIRGVTLRVLQIYAVPGEDLTQWLEAARGKKGRSFDLEQKHLHRTTVALSPQVTTDAEGRFRLTGIGRNRLIRANIDGPTIASQELHILTRPGKAIEVTEDEGNPEYGEPRRVTIYYGASFRHAAAPTKPIVGVVRDKDTRRPLAGVTIRSYSQAVTASFSRGVHLVRTTTDAEGRYRLMGMPKGAGQKIAAIPVSGQPYVVTSQEVPDSPGLGPVTVDFDLKRGVWIEGKLTDTVTGKPVTGSVDYFSFQSNPNLHDYPGFDGTVLMFQLAAKTKEDGSYRIIGLPGPGLIGVRCEGSYLHPNWKELGLRASGDGLELINTSPYCAYVAHFKAFVPVDPPKGALSSKWDAALDPGWTFSGTLLGPDGKPLAGARGFRVGARYSWGPLHWWQHEAMKTAAFTITELDPRWPRDVLFKHSEKGLIGALQPPKENGGTVTVQMVPGATVTGRLVGADGRPRAANELEVRFRARKGLDWAYDLPERIKTDKDGRFRLEALLPGYEYRFTTERDELDLGSAPRSGQTKDLGDVRMKRDAE